MKRMALLLATVLLLEGCAGALARKPEGPTAAAAAPDSAIDTGQEPASRRKLWPWAVTGAAIGTAVAASLIGVLIYGLSQGDWFDGGSGTDYSPNVGTGDGGLPVLAQRQ